MREPIEFLKQLRHYAGWRLYAIVLGMLLVSLLEGIGIYLIVPMVQLLTNGVPTGLAWIAPLLTMPVQWLLAIMLSVYVCILVGIALFQRGQSLMTMRVQQGYIRSLRLKVYKELLQANWEFYLQKRKTDLQTMLTTELARVAQGILLMLNLLTALIFALVQVMIAFYLSWQLTLLVIVCGLIIASISRRFVKRAKELGEQTSELSKSYLGIVGDHFGSVKEVKSNMLERTFYGAFRKVCEQMERNMVNFVTVSSNTQLIYRVSSAILIALFIYGSYVWLKVEPERLLVVALIFTRLWPKFTAIQKHMEQIASSIPAYHRLEELLAECEQHREVAQVTARSASAQTSAFELKQGIACHQVFYRYNRSDERFTLEDINLFIPAGTITALIGKSGSGKSTLIDLIMGLIRPESGCVEYDGEPLTDEQRRQLRSVIGYVPQEPTLLHASIRENLLLMNERASDEELWEALTLSASDEFVRQLPEGLDTIVGDRGVRLSGGERQRLVLARAILRKPAILILDEATSALDASNEAIILETISRLKGKMTIIVIAHRLSTIRHSDQVLIMEQGKIIEYGELQQLTNKMGGVFSQWLNQQAMSVPY